ncbi:MAG: Radical SAM superfamily enzyme [Candidatus Methanohalarchaeum thermophilum]|uniref:Radical SAM superfamily enzyme n=1 Tax=Methanohalarchaeum thermophilum TaxID=1903181 RepID=A0A1Q6DXL0_METT1|nr:MAG: Radical SAM superfamily enzyme [Candidatus Methanohalarchaeum thermophilum]
MVNGLRSYSFEVSESWIRPTSEIEMNSLLLRVTRNCPWGKCRFCDCYQSDFELRSVKEIKKDVDAVYKIYKKINSLIGKIGWEKAAVELSRLYDRSSEELSHSELMNLYNIKMVYDWCSSSFSPVFLQDADNLVMKTEDLTSILDYIEENLSPSSISTYARSNSLVKKGIEDLKSLRRAGLSRCHVGLESGDDKVLDYINKGVSSEEHVLGGKKAIKAGLDLAEYVMPGIGGRKRSKQHAKETASVLNQINPDQVLIRPYVPRKNTPLYKDYKRGKFELTSPKERLKELKKLIIQLNIKTRICFDQPVMNSWYKTPEHKKHLFKCSSKGYKLPEEEKRLIKIMEKGKKLKKKSHIHPKDLIDQSF